MTTRYRITGPSPASVVAGCHEDGDIVTITGIANNGPHEHTSPDGAHTWATFHLIGDRTTVEVKLARKDRRAAWDLIGPGSDMRPVQVTVTGKVTGSTGPPCLIATDVTRNGPPAAPYMPPFNLDAHLKKLIGDIGPISRENLPGALARRGTVTADWVLDETLAEIAEIAEGAR